MSNCIIRYATPKDVPKIMTYIGENFKKNHILSRDKQLFKWQYTTNKLDYVIAIDEKNIIHGMLGFISYSNGKNRDIATSMWKADEGFSFLGLRLLQFVLENETYRCCFSPGINIKTTKKLYHRFGFKVDVMKQWYRLNKRENYNIANISDKHFVEVNNDKELTLVSINSFNELIKLFDMQKYNLITNIPYKSNEYLRRRYFEHPTYKYLIYGIKEKFVETIIILRKQECNNSCCLRFIDCIGNYQKLGMITNLLDELMNLHNAEYIDMYEVGLDDNLLYNAGWLKVGEDNNIIPNYFYPFESKNIDVYYCTTSNDIVLFKGDGDQDRPN